MTTIEYINTKNYRQRIFDVLAAERKALPNTVFADFAAPLEGELKRLDAELREFEARAVSSVIAHARLDLSSFQRFCRIVPMCAAPAQPNISINTPRKVAPQWKLPVTGL